MSDKKLLKNCPFCGGEARRSVIFGRNGVECRKCLCMMRGWLDATPEEIAEQWNTRVPMQKIVERLEDINMTAVDLANLTCSTYQDGVVSGIERSLEIIREEGGLDV